MRPRVFLDVEGPAPGGGREKYGRIIIELYSDEVPKTAENVRCLCSGERGLSKISGAPLHYKGSRFHRVIKNFMVQLGELPGGAKGGESIYGRPLEDESFSRKHSEPFLVSMANRGPNTATSQLFITTRPTPHLDDKHVVVGKVLAGQDVVTRIEETQTDAKDRPIDEILVIHSGELELATRAVPRREEAAAKPARGRSRSRSASSSSASASGSSDDSRKRRRSRSRSVSDSGSEKERKGRDRRRSTSGSASSSDSEAERKKRKREKKEAKRLKKEKKEAKREEKRRKKEAKRAAKKAAAETRNEGTASAAAPAPQNGRGATPPDMVPQRRYVDSAGRTVKGRGFTRYKPYEDDRIGWVPREEMQKQRRRAPPYREPAPSITVKERDVEEQDSDA
ncbi:cyclophilin-like domain-containing protein [Hyaloraphidium curvatum]|nr:cyclophilin-like domain-containing protein [Hyaloraphidium curvatum]